MKRTLSVALALVMILMSFVAYAETATATAAGYGGDVSVSLTVEGGVLTDVVIEGPNETLGVGSMAVEQMPALMIEANAVDVDIIAGATYTSTGILEAAATALESLGIELIPTASSDAQVELEPVYTDVLVVGAGGAGLSAAATAADEGADVILVEMLSFTGGSTAQSGGVMLRGANEGDPEGTMTDDELYDYLMEWSQYRADPEVVRTYVDKAGEDQPWAFSLGDGVQNTTRYHMMPENIMAIRPDGDATAAATGIILTQQMEKGVLERGVDLRLNTAATQLIVEDGKVIGAMVESRQGTYPIYAEGGVILCTGGFAQNKDLLAEYGVPNAELVPVSCTAGATGTGLLMARDIGAKIQFGPNWDTDGYHTLAASGYSNYLNMVLLNAKGQRFHREDDQLPFIYTDMVIETGMGNIEFFFLTDPNLDPNPDALVEMGQAVKCDTFEDLVAYIGCDAQTLQNTLDEYNANTGVDDPVTGKLASYMQGIEAPYYCVKANPIRVVTIGGIIIDKDAQVLDTDDNPIPGLYAAGELANGSFFYNVYSACGSAVGHAIVFGRIAAQNAVANID
ncbi:MAG: FAD-dependent oxidoreductase [Clostridia bacterium]|nr:FAD-dependent oxidoreductase [Clostridia bacterium]